MPRFRQVTSFAPAYANIHTRLDLYRRVGGVAGARRISDDIKQRGADPTRVRPGLTAPSYAFSSVHCSGCWFWRAKSITCPTLVSATS